jgi:hypothetical protein
MSSSPLSSYAGCKCYCHLQKTHKTTQTIDLFSVLDLLPPCLLSFPICCEVRVEAAVLSQRGLIFGGRRRWRARLQGKWGRRLPSWWRRGSAVAGVGQMREVDGSVCEGGARLLLWWALFVGRLLLMRPEEKKMWRLWLGERKERGRERGRWRSVCRECMAASERKIKRGEGFDEGELQSGRWRCGVGCRTSENPRGVGWRSFHCRLVCLNWFVGVAT